MSITIRIDQQPKIELNYCNRNAALVLGAIGIDVEQGYGEIAAAEIPALRRTLLRILNQTTTLQTAAPEEVWTRRVVTRGDVATIERALHSFDPGLDQEGVVRRLVEVGDLLAKASELHSDVSWS